MKIEIKYSTSEGPHLINISHAEIQQMLQSKVLVVTQPTPKGHKTITFSGTKQELSDLADALKNAK
jgi:hypothetical protein